MARFYKREDECVTEQDRILYLLKNSGNMEIPPRWSDEGPCKDILDALEIDDFSKEKRKQYDEDMYDEKRLNGELAAAAKMVMQKVEKKQQGILRSSGGRT